MSAATASGAIRIAEFNVDSLRDTPLYTQYRPGEGLFVSDSPFSNRTTGKVHLATGKVHLGRLTALSNFCDTVSKFPQVAEIEAGNSTATITAAPKSKRLSVGDTNCNGSDTHLTRFNNVLHLLWAVVLHMHTLPYECDQDDMLRIARRMYAVDPHAFVSPPYCVATTAASALALSHAMHPLTEAHVRSRMTYVLVFASCETHEIAKCRLATLFGFLHKRDEHVWQDIVRRFPSCISISPVERS